MKIIYYIRYVLFILYLLCMFLLIDKVLTINIYGSIFFLVSLIYSIFIILSILSKKKIFINTVSFNILNIGIYFYTFILYYFSHISSKLDILNNKSYYQNNFILITILLICLILFTIFLNIDEKDTP